MVVNDDAGYQITRVAWATFASKLAPTERGGLILIQILMRDSLISGS
jgi:hypothetical protein